MIVFIAVRAGDEQPSIHRIVETMTDDKPHKNKHDDNSGQGEFPEEKTVGTTLRGLPDTHRKHRHEWQ